MQDATPARASIRLFFLGRCGDPQAPVRTRCIRSHFSIVLVRRETARIRQRCQDLQADQVVHPFSGLAEALDLRYGKQTGQACYRHALLLRRLAMHATAFSPVLIDTVLGAVEKQMCSDGQLSAADLRSLVDRCLVNLSSTLQTSELRNGVSTSTRSRSSATSRPDQQGKLDEIAWAKKVHVYDHIPRAEAKKRGIPMMPIRWVLVDKGDPGRPINRCRQVGKEVKAKSKETLLAQEVFQCDDVLRDGESSPEHAGEQRGAEQQQSI